MKSQVIIKFVVITTVAAALLSFGCKKQESHAADDGHGHGPGGHGEAEAHTETKDGVLMCAEHGVPEAECAVCKPGLAANLKPGESLKVRLPSTNSLGIVGVQTAPPSSGKAWPSAIAMAASTEASNTPGTRLAGGGRKAGRVGEAGTADMGAVWASASIKKISGYL